MIQTKIKIDLKKQQESEKPSPVKGISDKISNLVNKRPEKYDEINKQQKDMDKQKNELAKLIDKAEKK